MAKLLDWRVSTGCAIHDVHNSLEWAAAVYADPKDHHTTLKCLTDALQTTD